MKILISSLGVMLCVLFAAATAAAQEMSFRNGVITDIQPIQVAAKPEPPKKQSAMGRFVRRVATRTLYDSAADAGGGYAYDAAAAGSDAVGDATVAASQGGEKEVTAYMVIVRFDDGAESAIQAAQTDNLKVGGRVRVFGSGSSARISPTE